MSALRSRLASQTYFARYGAVYHITIFGFIDPCPRRQYNISVKYRHIIVSTVDTPTAITDLHEVEGSRPPVHSEFRTSREGGDTICTGKCHKIRFSLRRTR